MHWDRCILKYLCALIGEIITCLFLIFYISLRNLPCSLYEFFDQSRSLVMLERSDVTENTPVSFHNFGLAQVTKTLDKHKLLDLQ